VEHPREHSAVVEGEALASGPNHEVEPKPEKKESFAEDIEGVM
jgi:hypothetical protein